jgi:hypothetical protein
MSAVSRKMNFLDSPSVPRPTSVSQISSDVTLCVVGTEPTRRTSAPVHTASSETTVMFQGPRTIRLHAFWKPRVFNCTSQAIFVTHFSDNGVICLLRAITLKPRPFAGHGSAAVT